MIRPQRQKYHKNVFPIGSKASYPAMPIIQNGQKFYLATIPVSDIFPFSFVSRRQDSPIEGFQRNLNEGRARDIARYLDNSIGSIPTNIVLSAQPEAELEYNSSSKIIKFKRVEKGFLIIDGQHRMFGYGQTRKSHRVPVAIYIDLSRKEESSLFIDINTNQRGVPASLLLDIKQVAKRESEIETQLRIIFDKLNKDSQSPLCGLLSPAASKVGKISRVTFNKSMQPILENDLLLKLSEEKQYLLILNYIKALESVLSNKENDDLLVKSVYFETFCSIFDEVLEMAYAKNQNYKYKSLLEVLEPIGNYDIKAILTGGKTKVTKKTLLPYFKKIIKGQQRISEDMV